MDVVIVGSGTLVPDDRHRSAGHLLQWRDGRLLLDCGSGVVHGLERDGIDWRGISHVAITHFHTDHIGDLPALLWAWKHADPREDPPPRTLLGPPGTRRVLGALAEAHGEFIFAPGAPLDLIELPAASSWEDPAAGLTVRTHEARHTPEALAYRIEAAGRTVGYTGDTGPHLPLGEFFREVDLLISECAVADGSSAVNHLSPGGVAQLAVAARVRELVLTHLYPEVERDGLAATLRSLGVEGPIQVAEDGLRISL